MDVIEAITKRKSIRDFKSDHVPQDVIREILEVSCRTPSAMNTQPWEFTVVTGETLDSIRLAALEKLQAGEKFQPEHSVSGWPAESVYRKRQVALGMEIFQIMDIGKEDTAKRSQWLERGFRYFNAPAAIIITVDRMLAEGTPIFDIGAITQTLCLAALHHGLGTCIENQGVMYPDILRKYCHIPDDKQIIIAIAIGYPNWDFPANRLETTRESVDTVSNWYGFD
mgnify:CR=1 FL=1